jgi:hypothetical protein
MKEILRKGWKEIEQPKESDQKATTYPTADASSYCSRASDSVVREPEERVS